MAKRIPYSLFATPYSLFSPHPQNLHYTPSHRPCREPGPEPGIRRGDGSLPLGFGNPRPVRARKRPAAGIMSVAEKPLGHRSPE